MTNITDTGALTTAHWPGSISVTELINDGATSNQELDDIIARLDEFYVPVSPRAYARCIDGRHAPDFDESTLGPQVPGGTPGAALAYRLAIGSDTDDVFMHDAQVIVEAYARLGYSPGAHRDEQNATKPTVGCGAIDKMDQALAAMLEPDLKADHKRLVSELLGDTFDEAMYNEVAATATAINSRADSYFADRADIVDAMETDDPKSVVTLQGTHRECLVVINLVPNSTLATNRFADTFHDIQAFGFDVWVTNNVASEVFSETDEAAERSRFVLARIMMAVATLMVLTDGSQRLVLRAPAH